MSDHGQHEVYHVTPFEKYVKVFSALIILTLLTVGISRIDLGWVNTIIAMVIATIKASLVVMFFMHQKHEVKLNRIIFALGFIFLSILFGFTATDLFTRHNFTEIKYSK